MKRTRKTHPNPVTRLRLVRGLFAVFFVVVLARAFKVQLLDHDRMTAEAATITTSSRTIEGRRGRFLDRHHRLLAASVETRDVGFFPKKVADLDAVARIASRVLGVDRIALASNLKRRNFVMMARKVQPAKVDELRQALGRRLSAGLNIDKTWGRTYPDRNLAAQLLGFTTADNKGLEGLERKLDPLLQGERTSVALFNGKGIRYGERVEKRMAAPGKDIVLTIDKHIQFIAEKALEEKVDAFDAAGGMAVVMDPATGEVLAMAQKPDFNPNNFGESDASTHVNRATRSVFEPGSTMKIFLVASALEEGFTRSDTLFDCEGGKYRIGPNAIHDTKPHELLTTAEVVKVSSNIGVAKLAEITGAEFLYKTLKSFGFDATTGIETGDTRGLLRKWNQWKPIDTANASFGQGYNVTAIQLATATSAIANGGLLMRPHVVREIRDPATGAVSSTRPETRRRVISARTAAVVRNMMHDAVMEGGTGTLAVPVGWDVGGKTGTAQKLVDGRYSNRDYIASFVGFAPYRDPKLVVLVAIDSPRKDYYGGLVAAPVFRKIVTETLSLMNIAPRSAPLTTAARKRDTEDETL